MPGSAWRGPHWKWHSCSSRAAPLLYNSTANCLVRGTMLEAVTLKTGPVEFRKSQSTNILPQTASNQCIDSKWEDTNFEDINLNYLLHNSIVR